MLRENPHLSDQDLLQASDGELSPRRAVAVRAHIASCWRCRARLNEIENTIAGFADVHEHNAAALAPGGVGSRAVLKAQLAALASASRPRAWRPALQYAGAAILCAAMGFVAIQQIAMHRDAAPEIAVPRTGLTPGATRPVTANDVCTAAGDDRVRIIPVALKRQVFQEYGLHNARPDDYEVDYLITPELGGSNDIRNLWPQSYSATVWNAHVKDALEDRLHRLVCEGKLELATAQRDIAADWISAYKKYFHTDKPL